MPFKMEQLISLGIAIILIGFIIVLFGIFMGIKETASTKTKVAFGGFIGPIPFGFGNDRNFVRLVTIIALILFLAWIILNLRYGR